eukprot:1157795-Pelagomonas_calceolata.AAC.5
MVWPYQHGGDMLSVQSKMEKCCVDPKSVVCEFYRHGQCTKGFKCKFSHDLNVEKKVRLLSSQSMWLARVCLCTSPSSLHRPVCYLSLSQSHVPQVCQCMPSCWRDMSCASDGFVQAAKIDLFSDKRDARQEEPEEGEVRGQGDIM